MISGWFLSIFRLFHVHRLGDTIKGNLPFFSEENLRKRLKTRLNDNAIIDGLVQYPHIPTPEQLEKDIELTSCKNPIVGKLILWRHNIIAHTGAKNALQKHQILADNLISKEEIEKLLDQSMEIFNRYSAMYIANVYARQIVGHDDYNSLIKFVNLGLEKWEEDIKKQIEQVENRNGK